MLEVSIRDELVQIRSLLDRMLWLMGRPTLPHGTVTPNTIVEPGSDSRSNRATSRHPDSFEVIMDPR